MGAIGWVLHGVKAASLPALFVCMMLETLGLPLPGESALIAASAAAGAGKLSLWGVLGAAWLGSVLGDNIGYLIGRHLGRRAIVSWGSRVGITRERYAKAEAIVERYGVAVVMVARFVVLLRQLNGLVAGSAGMPWMRFLVANIAGAAIWVGFWGLLAYYLGKAADVSSLIDAHWIVIAGLAMSLLFTASGVWFVWSRRKRG